MRNYAGLLIVALLLGGAMPAHGQATDLDIVLTKDTGGSLEVHLINDGGRTISFEVAHAEFENNPSAAFLTLTCAQGAGAGQCPVKETIVLDLVRATIDGTDAWRAQLSVDNKNLVRGDWSVVATGQSGTTTAVVPQSAAYTLEITAPNVAKPTLRALNVDANAGHVPVGKNQNVATSIESSLLRSVTFQIDNGPVLAWGAPYSLQASNFVPTGLHTLKVMAADRIGQTSEFSFLVYADTNDPDLAHSIPARLFLGVPNKIPLQVSDDSDVTVSARLGEQVSSLTGLPGSRAYAPAVTPTELGSQILEVRAVDKVGNVARIVQSVEVVPLEVDIGIVSVKQTDAGAILNEDMQVTIQASQRNGTIDIPVNVTYQGQDLGTFTVAKNGTTSHVVSFRMPAGVYSGNLTLVVAPDVTELDFADNTRMLTVEQFMARVIFRNDVYHIRAGANGLPDVAVGLDGKTYALTLKDRGLATVHAFTVDGNELYWNPASSVTTVIEPNNQEPTPEEGIPGLPVVALLGAIAVAGLLRRRVA